MRRRRVLALFASTLVLASTPRFAHACGGFFCDNVNPVVQTAERILFEVAPDGTTCVTVEVQYQGPPSNFGWVLPVPEALDPDLVETAPSGVFDELEIATAPTFERYIEDVSSSGAGSAEDASGCDFDDHTYLPAEIPTPDTSGVEVIGESVVGPYAIELISADSGENLANWLVLEGYQIPATAAEPMDHYIGAGLAFLGIKLQAEAPSGPIDALRFCYETPAPSIPLVLTRIAAAEEMEITAYVASAGRYGPANYDDVVFDWQSVSFVGEDVTDYEQLLRAATNGRAFVTELALPIAELPLGSSRVAALLASHRYLTRMHGFIPPTAMTSDPSFVPVVGPDVPNHHTLYEAGADARGPSLGLLIGFLPLVVVAPWPWRSRARKWLRSDRAP
jgi:hypothetical protein